MWCGVLLSGLNFAAFLPSPLSDTEVSGPRNCLGVDLGI